MTNDNGENKPSCGNCPYWTKVVNPNDVSERNGACKRYPPTSHAIVAPGNVQFLSMFPRTHADEVCGEHPSLPEMETLSQIRKAFNP